LRLFRIAIKALSRCDKASIATAKNFRFDLKICKSLIDRYLEKSPIFRNFRAEIRLHRKKVNLKGLKMTKIVDRIGTIRMNCCRLLNCNALSANELRQPLGRRCPHRRELHFSNKLLTMNAESSTADGDIDAPKAIATKADSNGSRQISSSAETESEQ
jgi:hypothetical protein